MAIYRPSEEERAAVLDLLDELDDAFDGEAIAVCMTASLLAYVSLFIASSCEKGELEMDYSERIEASEELCKRVHDVTMRTINEWRLGPHGRA